MKRILGLLFCISSVMLLTSCASAINFLEDNLINQFDYENVQSNEKAREDEHDEVIENIKQIEEEQEDFYEGVEEIPQEEVVEEPARIKPEDEWKLMLVNPWNSIPEGYMNTVVLQDLGGGHSMDIRAYADFKIMVEDAKAEGLNLYVGSSFRPHSLQQTYFESQTNAYVSMGYSYSDARAEAAKSVAIPGTSEHELGLALDITSTDYKTLDDYQAYTPEVRWLQANAWKYGFILRYPEDKYHITHITYEPWHFRYVGKEAAKEMYETGLCLEEYLQTKYEIY